MLGMSNDENNWQVRNNMRMEDDLSTIYEYIDNKDIKGLIHFLKYSPYILDQPEIMNKLIGEIGYTAVSALKRSVRGALGERKPIVLKYKRNILKERKVGGTRKHKGRNSSNNTTSEGARRRRRKASRTRKIGK